MDKDKGIFLLAGILLGLVIGYVGAYQIHRPSPAAGASSTGPTHAASADGAGGPPADQGEALMQEVTQNLAGLRARLEKDPRDLEALISLGNMFSDAGKYPDAIDYYNRALQVNPDNPDVLSDLGVCYRSTGDSRRAIETFRKATQMHPEHWQSWLNISIVSMFDLNDLPQAEEALARAEKLQPNIPNLKALRDHLQQLRGASAAGRS